MGHRASLTLWWAMRSSVFTRRLTIFTDPMVATLLRSPYQQKETGCGPPSKLITNSKTNTLRGSGFGEIIHGRRVSVHQREALLTRRSYQAYRITVFHFLEVQTSVIRHTRSVFP